MPLSLRRGRVTAIVERHDALVRLEVDGVACVAYPRVTGEVQVGDEAIVNVQARELELGSGGFDVLYANLTRGLELPPERDAHVMNLPYAPGQHAVRQVEEDGPRAEALGGLPVVCCTVHSQLAPVCAGLDGARVAYVQVGGGALPVDLSDAVRAVRTRGLVEAAVAVAPCFGGDAQAVTTASALVWAAGRGFDAAVCSVGPGIVGTGTRLGNGALALADAANVASALGGSPILVPRVSERDERARHRGLSHHTRSVYDLCLGAVALAWPAGFEAPAGIDVLQQVEAAGWREACAGLPLSFMGRGPDEEAAFFAAAYAAGRLAARAAADRAAGMSREVTLSSRSRDGHDT
jgi:hypothetical protein